MIDLQSEQIIPLSQSCREPGLRNARTGKPCHIAQAYRYTQIGARAVDGSRVRLETVKLPSGLCTSREAIERFVARLTDPDTEITAPSRSRKQAIKSAEAELVKAGFEIG